MLIEPSFHLPGSKGFNGTYQAQDEKRYRRRQQQRPAGIKFTQRHPHALALAPALDDAQVRRDRHGRDADAEEQRRDLHAKLPPPAERLGHGAAERGAQRGADAEGDVDEGLVRAAASVHSCH